VVWRICTEIWLGLFVFGCMPGKPRQISVRINRERITFEPAPDPDDLYSLDAIAATIGESKKTPPVPPTCASTSRRARTSVLAQRNRRPVQAATCGGECIKRLPEPTHTQLTQRTQLTRLKMNG
jgi:hypothetical protein